MKKRLAAGYGLLASTALLPMLLQTALAQAPVPAAHEPLLLQADQIVYDGDNEIVSAVGHVEIADEGRILNADSVTYDQKNDRVTANGHVSITDTRGNVAFADHVVLTDRMRNGALSGFGALIGKSGRLAAANAQRIQDRIVIAYKTVYSSCKVCAQKGQRTPLWQVKSQRVVYDQEKHRIRFQNATVEFLGVPVIYTPFLSQPDPSVKYASGFLAPDLGNSTTIGYFARVPVYISIHPGSDLTFAPQYATKGGEMLQTEYRARWNESGMWLQASVAHNSKGGLGGTPGAQTYDHLFGSGRFQLNDSWRTGFDAQLTNNHAYMRYYDISYLDRLVNDLFVEKTFGRSRLALTSYYFQGLRSTDVVNNIPYVLPRLEYSYIPTRKVAGGQMRLDVNGIAIARDSGRNTQRLTGEINWQRQTVFGGGQLWTFVLDGRGDGYNVETPATAILPASSNTISRGTGYAELDWRWPFVANGKRAGYFYLLEPIAQLIAQPYGGNPAGLRNEDSSAFEFDENNFFSVNQLPGYDLIESGPRANIGLQAQAFFPTGEVRAVIGQTYRLRPDPIFLPGSGQTGNSSDIVGQLNIKFPYLSLTDRFDVDRANGTLKRHEIYVTQTYGRSSLQVSYLQLPQQTVSLSLAPREQVNAQADLNFYENWQAFAAVQRDLASDEMLGIEYGLGYEDECLAVSLAYRRKYTFDTILGVPPSSSIVLRFSLKTGDQAVQPFSLFPRDVFNNANHS